MQGLSDIDFQGKVALVRADLNVPLDGERITEDTRIKASLPSLQAILEAGGGCIVMSHLGRPTEGKPDAALSLLPVAKRLSELLEQDVPLVELEHASRPALGAVMLLENTRFNEGEKANDEQLAKRYAELGDVFVMDAFASAHRAEASTVALAKTAKQKCAGLLLQAEADALAKAVKDPARPLLAIVGGAKVSTKLAVLDQLAGLADQVVVGGGIANTFLAAAGMPVGKSLCEKDMLSMCENMLDSHGAKLHMPKDIVVADSLDAKQGMVRPCNEVGPDEMILDVGPDSLAQISSLIEKAGTIVWNGALGVFEKEAFSAGTKGLAQAIAAAPGFTLAGGGETVAAAKLYQVADKIDCLSTGGGAFLEFIEGKELPGLQALQ